MGQYHLPVNLDKREYIYPHKFGSGLKMLEWGSGGATTVGLTVLLACSHSRGGGDLNADADLLNNIGGRWAGDRIIVLGDYSEPGDPGIEPIFEMMKETVRNDLQFALRPPMSPYSFVCEHFTDISREVIECLRCDSYLAQDLDDNPFYKYMLEEEQH